MSSSSIEAWHSWSHELPSCTDCVSSHSPSNALFTDDKFLRSMYQELRSRAFDRLIDATKGIEGGAAAAAAVLQGGVSSDWELYDTDVDKAEFRQESFFRYLFGINEPDCYGVLDLKSHKSILFVPFASDDSERWNGERRSLSYYIDKYGVDECYWTNDLDEKLQEKGIDTVYLLYGENSDSGNMTKTTANWKGIEKYHQNKDLLIHILTELRVIKTKREIELMRAATRISSEAHVYVMRHIHPNMSELQCEALFQAYTRYFGSSRHMAYTCICGSGNHGAILHYGHAGRPNDKILVDGDYMVLDMGAEYVGYATDITRSYPINGKFTADQRAIHNAVYEAQKAVIDAMKPGVSWPSMHRLAERVIIEHLLKLGVVHNGTVDELMAAHIGTVFMPHGLGHLLGMAVHDVGGYEHGKKRSAEPGLCWLRCGRPLQAGMVITVEPGIYFNEKWIAKALNDPMKSKYLNTEVIARFKNFGGCRLEDDVLVTENGADNLTILPTTPDQIELVMQNAKKK